VGPLSPAARGRRGKTESAARRRGAESEYSREDEESVLGESSADRSKSNSGEL
jgi:hypothetical protein